MTTSTPWPRFVAFLLIGFAIVLIVPLVVLASYNHPSPADDYCFANTVLQYGFWQAQRFYYDGWTGRFFHNFLVHANPLVIGWYGGYKVYPVVLLAIILLSFYVFANQWLYKTFGAGTRLAFAAGLFIGFMSTMAGLPEFLYWYTGMASYGLSSGLFMLLLATLLGHQRRGFGLFPGYLLAECLLIAAIVGASEMTMVTVMSLLGIIALGQLIQERRLTVPTLLLVSVGLISCYFLMSAPGNAIRMGGNPNSSNIPLTLVSSLRYSVGYVAHQVFLTPLLPLSILYVPIAWQLVGPRSSGRPLPAYLRLHPLLGLLHGAATIVALISLHFYGVGIPPIARLINLINLVFWLVWGYNLTLWVVALRTRVQSDRWQAYARPVAVLAVVWAIVMASIGPVVPMIYGDWLSGRAAEYDKAMQQRYQQLAAQSGAASEIAPLQNYPASLFLEDIKTDPKHLWNRCWADYFHKKTITLQNVSSQSAR
ncbi:hypothetical protein ACFSUS_08470 [Spirosoma soli]|uniref:YfhO family protein n=1 Tax=Spirosoma soli TaxID=1770529 RepID=A0ABW5M287_9BACT